MKLINNSPIIILIYLSYLKDEVNKQQTNIIILIHLSYLKDEVNKQQTYYNINIFVLFKG